MKRWWLSRFFRPGWETTAVESWRNNRGVWGWGRLDSARHEQGRSLFKAGVQEATAALTDWLGLEGAGETALAFAFAVDGGHLHLVVGLGFQANDGDGGYVCGRKGGVKTQQEGGKKKRYVRHCFLLLMQTHKYSKNTTKYTQV